ncbi:unnamed protein product [Leuciscus chuanchicus]
MCFSQSVESTSWSSVAQEEPGLPTHLRGFLVEDISSSPDPSELPQLAAVMSVRMPGPHVSVPTGPADREQSPDDGRPSTSSQPSRRGPALKRQLDQVHDSHQSAEDEMPMRKRTRMRMGSNLFYVLYVYHQPISSEESASQESQNRSVDLTSLLWSSGEHLSLHWSGLGQGQIVEDQTTANDNILSRYEMGRMIGEGAYGSVYAGKRLEDGLEVAVKIVRKPQNLEYINIPGHPAPFPLEVGLLILANGGPKVSEIIELLDWQDQPDQYIMVLERPSSCEDLWHFSRRHREGILDEDTARRIMAQATTAAHVCCRRGVFHRDVKLENLLINTETLEVKLIDFGCGDLLQEAGYERFSGTISYRPPEHYTEGKYHGKPATVWSLGVLLFLLVCGRFPGPKDRQTIEDDIWSDPGLSNDKNRKDKVSNKSIEEGRTTRAMAAEQLTLAMLVAELEKNRNNITEELTKLIKTSLSPIQNTLEAVKQQVELYEVRFNEAEDVLTDHSDRISTLESSVAELRSSVRDLTKENNDLRDMLDGYENRQRRTNLRVLGVAEDSERGKCPLKFMSELLVKVLNDDSLSKAPELERCHRAPMPKPSPDANPLPFILCFHCFQERERVLQLAIQKRQLFYEGRTIFIFPDLSARLAAKCSTYKKVKSQFYEKGVKFSLRYPATLVVYFEGSRHSFSSAETAETFYNQHFGSNKD